MKLRSLQMPAQSSIVTMLLRKTKEDKANE